LFRRPSQEIKEVAQEYDEQNDKGARLDQESAPSDFELHRGFSGSDSLI
jgi:hypothetical protein